ncbi:hypothetical protein D3C86_2148220 [compost metagenome]
MLDQPVEVVAVRTAFIEWVGRLSDVFRIQVWKLLQSIRDPHLYFIGLARLEGEQRCPNEWIVGCAFEGRAFP